LNITQHIPEEDLALYAMQALEPEETAPVRVHLEGCAQCRTSLAEVSGDLAAVALTVEQLPFPEGARERFLDLVERLPQPQSIPVPRPVPATTSLPGPVPVPPRRAVLPLLVPWAVAAALAVAAAYLDIRDGRLEQQLAGQRYADLQLEAKASRAQQVLEVLTSPHAKRIALTEGKTPAAPIGHATYVPGSGALVFIANNLRPVPGNKTYELWLIPANGMAPIPAGLFRPDSVGSASVLLPDLPSGVEAKAFGVTIEDAQGATTPTAPIVLSGS
jgi:hypothetical protein